MNTECLGQVSWALFMKIYLVLSVQMDSPVTPSEAPKKATSSEPNLESSSISSGRMFDLAEVNTC